MADTDEDDRTWLDDYDKKVLGLVDEYGWAVQAVGGTPEDPQFAYTVGLSKWGQPEVIMFGLSFDVMKTILNIVGAEVRNGRQLHAGDTEATGDDRYTLEFVAVPDSSEHLTMANRMFRDPDGAPLAALQLVFPDKEGKYPWDPEYALSPNLQPVLGTHESKV